jgi:uncharacterized protein (TIGR03118 family)
VAVMLAGAYTVNAQRNAYLQTVLVSNVANGSAVVDPNLVDPWGISFSAASPFWVSDHLSGKSTLYNGAGAITNVVVTIPPGSASAAGSLGRPTGQVRPLATTPASFVIPAPNGRAASFIFATEDGTISAWNAGTVATITVDNSAKQAVYKGLAIGASAAGPAIYAANFRSGKIDVFDAAWAPITLAGSFFDPRVPAGFAPFNIWNLNTTAADGSAVTYLYVAWAKQDANKYLDVAGNGNGHVSVFDLNGNLVSHLASGTPLNSPWGVAIAPPVWGAFGGAVLVGNFGDGKINAFDPKTGSLLGFLEDTSGNPIAIAGLWAIVFGNGGNGGDVNTLYYAAGQPNGSTTARGLLGSIAPPSAIQSVVNAASRQALCPSSFAPNAICVAPGEIVTIRGQTVGPSPGVAATIPPATPALATTLGGTSVTVNGIAAPILYTNGSQTNIQIPYEVSGAGSVSIVVKAGGQSTAAFVMPATAVSPGIFTIDFTGTKQAVALNSDGTVNSSTNPAARGATIVLFATGEGMTYPASGNGMLQTDTSRVPVAPVTVTFSNNANLVTEAPTSSTTIPRDVSGVLAIAALVPTSVNAGLVNVAISVGGVSTSPTQSVYIYVK